MASLVVLIAGPYRSGTGDDPAKMAANVRAMEAYALPLFRAGHVPLLGEFDEVFHPIAERLLARCDAVLRVGGASRGADDMVGLATARGIAVYRARREVPGCEGCAEPVRP